MIHPCLTHSNIRYISRVKWSNPGKGIAPSPRPRCSSYWKGSLLVALDYGHHYFLLDRYPILSFENRYYKYILSKLKFLIKSLQWKFSFFVWKIITTFSLLFNLLLSKKQQYKTKKISHIFFTFYLIFPFVFLYFDILHV